MTCYGYELIQCGYRPYSPSQEVAEMDAEIAEAQPCSKCGGPMHYEAYTNESGSYIALAVCNDCGYEEEF